MVFLGYGRHRRAGRAAGPRLEGGGGHGQRARDGGALPWRGGVDDRRVGAAGVGGARQRERRVVRPRVQLHRKRGLRVEPHQRPG